MGLFIGASILTLLEILDYIYEVRTHGKAQRVVQALGWAVDSGF